MAQHSSGVVVDRGQAEAALAAFSGRAELVRVMPHLEGIPCSIHGMVLAGEVIVLRPVELLVLERPDGSFCYTGCATFYDPRPDDAADLRAVGRLVGERLASEVGFRGAFTVDGVMTRQGFRPTELNPRTGAGITALTRGIDLPIALLLDLAVHGAAIDWRAGELEAVLLDSAEHRRAGSTYLRLPLALGAGVRADLAGDLVATDDGLRPRALSETPTVVYHSSVEPGWLTIRAELTGAGHPPGRSIAETVAEFWRWLDHHASLGLGPLTAARDVRS